MKPELYWRICDRQTSIFTKNPPSGSRFDKRGRRDRQTCRRVAFRNFADVPKYHNITRVFEQQQQQQHTARHGRTVSSICCTALHSFRGPPFWCVSIFKGQRCFMPQISLRLFPWCFNHMLYVEAQIKTAPPKLKLHCRAEGTVPSTVQYSTECMHNRRWQMNIGFRHYTHAHI